MRVAIIGTGYVGLVTGTCLSDVGNDVVCCDVDPSKVQRLLAGELTIYEPGLEELFRRNSKAGRLKFTTNASEAVRNADVCVIAVGTPEDKDGSADRRYVLEAVRSVAESVNGSTVILIKSTVPVGTCDRAQRLVDDVLSERAVTYACPVVSNPEFLKEGKAVEDFVRPDRVVIGTQNEAACEVVSQLYAPFVRNGHPVVVVSRRSSEMIKYVANAMLATRISLMNELAQLCEKVGADVADVRLGVGTDRRIGMDFLYAGVGYGGSCFPKDIRALSRMAAEEGTSAEILDAVDKVNRLQKLVLAKKIVDHFGGILRGKKIAIWGLAFKPHTDDIREAPALTIIKRLLEVGADVVAFDPEAAKNAAVWFSGTVGVSFVDDPYKAVEGADAVALVTEWGVFRSLDMTKVKTLMRSPVFFDGRNQYEPAKMREFGFQYECIGRA